MMNQMTSILNRLFNTAAIVLPAFFFSGCGNLSTSKEATPDNIDSLAFTVEEAPEWTALFKRSSGWIGGDGIFAIPLNGVETYKADDTSETLIHFSDTMIGDIVNDSLKPGLKVVHNSVAILRGNEPDEKNISFYWNTDSANNPATTFVPSVASSVEKDLYWLGDGFVNQELDSSYFAFGYIIRSTGPTDWDFKEAGNVLIEIPKGSKPPFNDQKQTETPLLIKASSDSAKDGGSFGAGILVNTEGAGALHPDGYVYVYGIRGAKKDVMVARVKPAAFKQFEQWQFFDGKDWNADMLKAASIADSVSNEMSVTALPDGRYAMIFQVNGLSSKIGMRLGKTPWGPFGKVINVWDCSGATKAVPDKMYTYNAKAHPNLSKPGELLISYNVNAFDFYNIIKSYPDLYRPRFIKLKFQ